MTDAAQYNLKFLTDYNPETGVFKRIRRTSWKGNIVSCNFTTKAVTHYGYFQMNIFGRPYLIHRLIYLFMTGEFPEHDVDHINGDRTDNRWCNLRQVTRLENLHNIGLRNSNSTGYVGVSLRKDTGKYHAYIDDHNIRIHLGNFEYIDDAIKVRQQAELKFEYHPNHGERPTWVK